MQNRDARLADLARPRILTALALGTGAGYLLWRAGTLGSGSMLAVSLPLYLLELWAFAQLVLLGAQTWRIPAPTTAAPLRRPATGIDLAVVAVDADHDQLERSLLGARSVRGRDRVVVIDDVDRPEIRQLAVQFDAAYEIDAGAAEAPASAAHHHTNSALYVWLQAGQVPMPDLLQATAPTFDDPEVAVCQVATSLLNADSLAHLRRERDDDALLNRVLGPALTRWGAAPWVGGGAVIRRHAIDAVGGYAGTSSISRMAIRLHQHGWSTRFERRRLVAATAPDTLDAYLGERRRQSAESFGLLRTPENPFTAPGLSARHRVRHLAAINRFTAGAGQALMALLVTVTLVSGVFPATAPLGRLAVFWLVANTTAMAARTAIARGAMVPGDWVRQGWRTLGADMAGLRDAVRTARTDRTRRTRASSGLRALAHLRALTVLVVVLDVALLVRAATLIDAGLLPSFTTGERILVIGAALSLLVPMVDVLQVVVLRQQRRAHHRLHVALDVTLEGVPATTVDIAPTGVGLTMPFAPEIGALTGLRFELPQLDGSVVGMSGQAVVRDVRKGAGPGTWRVGLEFTRLAEAARLALVEFCAVGHVAHHKPSYRDLPTAPVASLAVRRAGRHHRTLQAVTSAAAMAAVVTLIVGPGARAAIAEAAGEIEAVCVTSSSGDPVAGAAVESKTGGGWRLLGATDRTGCVRVAPSPATKGFAVTYEALRRQVEESELSAAPGTRLSIALSARSVRVLSSYGEPAPGIAVRYFTDEWRVGSGPTDNNGRSTFESFDGDLFVEVARDGARYVQPLPESGDTTIVLSRLRAEEAADRVVELDRGAGWEPFQDGTELVPGRLVLRLESGEIVKIDVPPGTEVAVPSGTLTPVVIDPEPEPTATTEPTTEPEPTATTEPTTEPEPTATTEPEPTATTEPTTEPEPTATTEPTLEPTDADPAGEGGDG